jgi:hypothetical protein
MKININGNLFDEEVGKRVLKLKYEHCPFPELETEWENIEVGTLASLSRALKNMEQRRVAFQYFDMDRLARETPGELVSREAIIRKTSWVMPDGSVQKQYYKEEFFLYSIDAKSLGVPYSICNHVTTLYYDYDNYLYYVKYRDPFTDHEHIQWVDGRYVADLNRIRHEDKIWTSKINAVQAYVSTITTDIEKGGIECIVRQGDCILFKKNNRAIRYYKRHLTEYEYRTLPVLKG